MIALMKTFSIPWQLWVMFGFIIGGILFNKTFRNETDGLAAHMLGLKPKRNRRK